MYRYCRISVMFLLLFFAFFAKVMAEEILTWQDCIKEAAKNHPDLISAQEVVKESQASKEITASNYFPQISAEAGASTAKTESSANTYTYGITGKQVLFDAFKTGDNVKAASENIKAAQYNYKFTSSEVRLRLRTAFINLLRAQQLVKVTEDIVKIRRGNLGLITLRYQSGLEHKGALLTAEADLAQANFGLAQAKRGIELAQRQLTKEMGRKEFIPMFVKADFKLIDPAKVKPDFEVLAENNPSLGKLIAQKNAASYSLKAAKADFFPQASLQAGADKSGSHWLPGNDQWNASVTISLPLFEGGLKQAQESKAMALFKQAQADERSTRDGVIVALIQNWASFQDAIETVEVQYKALVAAEERAKIAEAQYSTGFIAYDNWSIIEDNLVRTKTDYLNAQANALLAEANWIQAKGETLEYAQ